MLSESRLVFPRGKWWGRNKNKVKEKHLNYDIVHWSVRPTPMTSFKICPNVFRPQF